eukprot:6207614-Pleurochrysis_carterae.AAC.1
MDQERSLKNYGKTGQLTGHPPRASPPSPLAAGRRLRHHTQRGVAFIAAGLQSVAVIAVSDAARRARCCRQVAGGARRRARCHHR